MSHRWPMDLTFTIDPTDTPLVTAAALAGVPEMLTELEDLHWIIERDNNGEVRISGEETHGIGDLEADARGLFDALRGLNVPYAVSEWGSEPDQGSYDLYCAHDEGIWLWHHIEGEAALTFAKALNAVAGADDPVAALLTLLPPHLHDEIRADAQAQAEATTTTDAP